MTRWRARRPFCRRLRAAAGWQRRQFRQCGQHGAAHFVAFHLVSGVGQGMLRRYRRQIRPRAVFQHQIQADLVPHGSRALAMPHDIRQNAKEPGREGSPRLKLPDGAIRLQERILHDIFGQRVVARQQHRQMLCRLLVACEQET